MFASTERRSAAEITALEYLINYMPATKKHRDNMLLQISSPLKKNLNWIEISPTLLQSKENPSPDKKDISWRTTLQHSSCEIPVPHFIPVIFSSPWLHQGVYSYIWIGTSNIWEAWCGSAHGRWICNICLMGWRRHRNRSARWWQLDRVLPHSLRRSWC